MLVTVHMHAEHYAFSPGGTSRLLPLIEPACANEFPHTVFAPLYAHLRILRSDGRPSRSGEVLEAAAVLPSGVHAQPLVALDRSGALDRIGRDRMIETFDEVLAPARVLSGATPDGPSGPAQRPDPTGQARR